MPKVSQAHKEIRRKQILDAALECFIKGGFHRTGMREICQAAQLSPGAVYGYFPNKAALIAGIAEQNQQSNALAHEQSRRQNVPDPVATVFRDHFMASLNDPARLRQSVLNLDGIAEAQRDETLSPLIADSFAAVAGELARTVRAGQERGEIDASLDAAQLSWSLQAQYLGLLALKLAGAPLDADAVAETFLAGICARDTESAAEGS